VKDADMNSDDFEKRLQAQPLRQLPPEWREQILSAAKDAATSTHASRVTHHNRPSLLSTVYHQLSTLLWPHPAAWAGLAAVWVVILGINLTTGSPTRTEAKLSRPASPQFFMAFQEQQRLLNELLATRETPVADRPKTGAPRPRSELHGAGTLMA
jgi:hypothetical protein